MALAIKCVCKSQVERPSPVKHTDTHTTQKSLKKIFFLFYSECHAKRKTTKKKTKQVKRPLFLLYLSVFASLWMPVSVVVFQRGGSMFFSGNKFIIRETPSTCQSSWLVPLEEQLSSEHALKQASSVNINPNSSLGASLVLSKDAVLTSCPSFRDVDRPGQGSRWQDSIDGLCLLMRSFVHSHHQWDEFTLHPGSSLRGILFKTVTC